MDTMFGEVSLEAPRKAYLTGSEVGQGRVSDAAMLRRGGVRVVDAIASAGFDCVSSTNMKSVLTDSDEIDTDLISGCDVVVVDLSGPVNDPAISWEVGFACGKGIPVVALQSGHHTLAREVSFTCFIEYMAHSLTELQLLLLELALVPSDTTSTASASS